METFDRLADEAAAGSLTAEQLFNAAIEDDEQADETPVAQPASTSIRIDRMPGSTTVTYGGRVSFAIWILLWLACFPVAAAAFRAEVEDAASILHVEAFIALARLVPPMPSVDAWVASQPLAWLIGACILGGCAALAWPLRVRRVRIEPAAVSVHRGLRPWPRRYARPPYNGIVNLRQALYLKSDGFSLYTPTASPMLSEDEARWLASEMRRAMKETAMRVTMFLLAASVIVPGIASAQAGAAPRNDLPQPYRTERSWGELPPGVTWAAVTAIEPAPDGTIYVVHRCFENSCAGRPEAPVLKYNADGKLLGSFGQGVFVFPHGGTVDAEGNLWMTDAGSAPGKGHQVFKFSPDGRILMTLGKAGVSGSGRDLFDQPTDIVVAPGGDLFVTDSHRNGTNNRVVHFTKEGRFVKEWGRKGSGRGEISEPHTIAMDSRGRLFVGDRENNRIQIFDQSGSFLEEWRQFGRPSGIAITGDDRIYVADSESWGTDTGAHELPGIKKGIRIGSARTGIVDAFIEDQESTAADHAGAEGVGVDMQGNVYGGVVRRRMLERHIRR
jgi:DNA-binding beta-propeller fold protein YncE